MNSPALIRLAELLGDQLNHRLTGSIIALSFATATAASASNSAPRQSLAASFGDVKDLTTLLKLDNKVKVLIATSLKRLSAIPAAQRTWDNVHAAFLNNAAAEPVGPVNTIQPEPFEEASASDFKFNGSPDPALVDKVMHWWKTTAVPDADIRKDIMIDINDIANIVAQSGATVSSLWDIFAKNEYHEKQVMDLSVLRYPDMDRPYFKLYRIVVFAFSDCERILWHQTDRSGLRSTLTYRIFKPRDSVIASLSEETIKEAAQTVDNLFKDG